MAGKSNHRGSYIVDIRLRGIGRVKRSLQTKDPKHADKLKGMIRTLHDTGRSDLIRAWLAGRVPLMDLWFHFRNQELHDLPFTESVIPLRQALDWCDGNLKLSPAARADYKCCFRSLLKLRHNATVTDLPELLQQRRDMLEAEGKAAMFNYIKAAASSFVSDTLGRDHALRRSISGVQSLPKARKREGQPTTVRTWLTYTAKMDGSYADQVLDLLLTGLRPKEYFEVQYQVNEEERTLTVKSTKVQGKAFKRRVMPLLRVPVTPSTGVHSLRNAVRSATGGKHQVYDLRRSFALLLQLAKVPRIRRQIYLGHAKEDVSDLYEHHELAELREQDRRAILAVMKEHGYSESAAG